MVSRQISRIARVVLDRRFWCLICTLLLAPTTQAEEAKKSDAPEFVRVRKNAADKPVALQTGIGHYLSADDRNIEIDLIGAVHIGEKSYYEMLNKRFKEYDAVMYELVAPEGTRIPKGGREGTGSAVSGLQSGMKDMLGLDFQLEQVDYSPENFIHADMSPDEFAKDMEERGDSFFKLFGRALGQGLVQQSKGGASDTEVMMALFSSDRKMRLRRIFASQIQDMDNQMRAIEGPNGSTLISERNAKAFEVMDREIKNGRKKIAVFYGAGHLDDMHQRLLKDFGMKLEKMEWVDAWKLQ